MSPDGQRFCPLSRRHTGPTLVYSLPIVTSLLSSASLQSLLNSQQSCAHDLQVGKPTRDVWIRGHLPAHDSYLLMQKLFILLMYLECVWGGGVLCVCLCVSVRMGTCVQVCRDQKETSSALLYHTLPYSIVTRSLTEHGLTNGHWDPESSCICSPTVLELQTCYHTQLIM